MNPELQVQTFDPTLLPKQHWERWERILDETPSLHSPFLRPGFVRAVTSVRNDVRVAAWEDESGWSYLPYHPARRGADALALGLSEWQAVVTRSSRVPWQALMESCGWRSFRYDHLCSWQPIEGQGCRRGGSPWVNLEGGYELYLARRRELGGRMLTQAARKARKIEREVGPLEFELNADRREAMQLLLDWKQQQHVRTGVPDAFQVPWIVALLHEVCCQNQAEFRGRISLLRSGGRPIAVHLGVEAHHAAHMWYPAYDTELASYSPGTLMWLSLAEGLSNEGLRRLDFGPGGQRYKDSLKTDDDEVALGAVDASRLTAAARRQWNALRNAARTAKSRMRWLAPRRDAQPRSDRRHSAET